MRKRSLRLLLCSGYAFLLYCLSFNVLAAEVTSVNNNGSVMHEQVCTKIEGRLQRLKCFDETFNTPIEYMQQKTKVIITPTRSEVWKRAFTGESTRKNKRGFNLTYADINNKKADMWLTATSKGVYHSDPSSLLLLAKPLTEKTSKNKQLPILMLSCLDNISRVEIVLPKAIKSARIGITIPGNPALTQIWSSDNSGFIIRSGRGLTAIEIMKTMLDNTQLVFRSNSAEIDGLYFDTKDLSQSIKPLRKACRW
ncbi:hypothetical protein PCNPT3_08410 [Psychromonas sp. CNPT3]|nr:hypothetical protein PCNPT3_08410 [Psychromonas sp. CNPT3]